MLSTANELINSEKKTKVQNTADFASADELIRQSKIPNIDEVYDKDMASADELIKEDKRGFFDKLDQTTVGGFIAQNWNDLAAPVASWGRALGYLSMGDFKNSSAEMHNVPDEIMPQGAIGDPDFKQGAITVIANIGLLGEGGIELLKGLSPMAEEFLPKIEKALRDIKDFGKTSEIIPNEAMREVASKVRNANSPFGQPSPVKSPTSMLPPEYANAPDMVLEDVKKNPIQNFKDWMARDKKTVIYSQNLENDFNNISGYSEADRLRGMQLYQKTKSNPAQRENLYFNKENPSGHPLTPEEEQMNNDELNPIRQAKEEIKARLRSRGVKVPEDDEGYIKRLPMDKGLLAKGKNFEEAPLTQTTGSLKSRVYKIATDEKGNRQVVSVRGGNVEAWTDKKSVSLGKINTTKWEELQSKETKPIYDKIKKLETEQRILLGGSKSRFEEARKRISDIQFEVDSLGEQISDINVKYDPDQLNNKVFVDRIGKRWTMGEAYTDEIEKNTNQKYLHDAHASEIVSYMSLKRLDRATELVEKIKEAPEFRDVSFKLNGRPLPKGYRTVGIPQFKDYAFTKRVAEVMDDFYRRSGGQGKENAYQVANKIVIQTMFGNPIIHTPNQTMFAASARGASNWLNPMAYPRLIRTGIRAIKAVSTLNQDYVDWLDAGASGKYSEAVSNQKLAQLFLKNVGTQLSKPENKTTLLQIAKDLGVGAARIPRAILNFSNKAMNSIGDIYELQAAYELKEARGISMKEAVAEVKKYFPAQAIPSRVLGNRELSRLMDPRSGVVCFGQYRAGSLNFFSNLIKDVSGGIANKDLPAIGRGVDKAIAMIAITQFVYPELDKVARWATHNPYAYVRRAGPATILYKTEQFAKGEIQAGDYIQTVLTPTPLLKGIEEAMYERDPRTGMKITPLQAIAQSVSPIAYGERIATNQLTPKNFLLGLVGIVSPNTTIHERMVLSNCFDDRPTMLKMTKALVTAGKKDEADRVAQTFNNKLMKNFDASLTEMGPNMEESIMRKQISRYLIKTQKMGRNTRPMLSSTFRKVQNQNIQDLYGSP